MREVCGERRISRIEAACPDAVPIETDPSFAHADAHAATQDNGTKWRGLEWVLRERRITKKLSDILSKGLCAGLCGAKDLPDQSSLS